VVNRGKDGGVAGQGGDELQQGSEHRSTKVPRWLMAAVLAPLLVAGVVAVLPHDPAPRAGPAPVVTPTSSPTEVLAAVDPALMLTSNEDVCTRTDHRARLSVSFGVVNLSSEPILVRRARPVLPLAGLRLTSRSIGRTSCGKTPGAQGRRVLPVGSSLVVTFNFVLPKQCPKPLPVEADVTIARRDASREIRERVHVLSDLGGLEFDQC
jgi:hypothetical protein